MNFDYQQLLQNVKNRSNPDNILLEKAFSDELSAIRYNDVLKYITFSMNGVEAEYTLKSKLAGERVQSHLKESLSNVVYKYQGSVMTNTHIRGNSDIDLLVIADTFYSFDRFGIEQLLNDYSKKIKLYESQITRLNSELSGGGYTLGLSDLRDNRSKSELKLSSVYDVCDISHSKAIKIKNKSLNRDVDIVIASWYDDVNSIIENKNQDYRGIQIYNKDTNSTELPDYPFLSIKRINERSSYTKGRLKKMIRFLKNVKVDSRKDIKLSSFDFNAICYDIDVTKYENLDKYSLVTIVYYQLYSLANNKQHSDNLKSVDDHEFIFKYNSQKLESLKNLMSEVQKILIDLKVSNI